MISRGVLFFKTFTYCSKERGFEICSHLYKLVSLFPLNRNTILMPKKLELYLCTPLSFFLDCVCQRTEFRIVRIVKQKILETVLSVLFLIPSTNAILGNIDFNNTNIFSL